MYLITVVHTALSWSDACTFDPILFAEVALKLALVLECKANLNDHQPRADSGELLESPNPGAQSQTDKQDISKKVRKCSVWLIVRFFTSLTVPCIPSPTHLSIGLSARSHTPFTHPLILLFFLSSLWPSLLSCHPFTHHPFTRLPIHQSIYPFFLRFFRLSVHPFDSVLSSAHPTINIPFFHLSLSSLHRSSFHLVAKQ